MRDLRQQLDDQLKAAYDLIKIERAGSFDRSKAAAIVLAMLPAYIEDDVIPRNRGRLSQHHRLTTRLHYIRATALWIVGRKQESQVEHNKIGSAYNCDEKEMYDGVIK